MQYNSLFKQNILQFIDFKGIKKSEFYRQTGITRSVLDKDSGLSEDNVAKFIAAYKDVNLEWFLTGEGSMLKEDSYFSGENNLQHEVNPNSVPYYDVDFSASFVEVTNNQRTKPDNYISHPFFKGCDYIVRASGQSMAKVIKHGDAIGLVKLDNWQDFLPMGEIYAIVTKNNFRMIKIITKGGNKDFYTLVSKPSDSKKNEFPPQEISKNQILSIFKVQATSHLF